MGWGKRRGRQSTAFNSDYTTHLQHRRCEFAWYVVAFSTFGSKGDTYKMRIVPTETGCGAEIVGIDLNAMTDAEVAAVADAQAAYGVVFLRDQELSLTHLLFLPDGGAVWRAKRRRTCRPRGGDQPAFLEDSPYERIKMPLSRTGALAQWRRRRS